MRLLDKPFAFIIIGLYGTMIIAHLLLLHYSPYIYDSIMHWLQSTMGAPQWLAKTLPHPYLWAALESIIITVILLGIFAPSDKLIAMGGFASFLLSSMVLFFFIVTSLNEYISHLMAWFVANIVVWFASIFMMLRHRHAIIGATDSNLDS